MTRICPLVKYRRVLVAVAICTRAREHDWHDESQGGDRIVVLEFGTLGRGHDQQNFTNIHVHSLKHANAGYILKLGVKFWS